MLNRTISKIANKLDTDAMQDAADRLDNLTKPPGSLGELEGIAVKLAGINHGVPPLPGRKVVIVMAGDHGAAEQKVSAYPQEVTAQMVQNILNGGAAINVLANNCGAEVIVVDMGVKHHYEVKGTKLERSYYNCRVTHGTRNMLFEPAMTKSDTKKAIEEGMKVASYEIDKGAKFIALGEMGIANTTAASAILSVISDVQIEDAVGSGTGVDAETLRKKCEFIRQAVELHKPDLKEPLSITAKVGSLEIAGMIGVILGASAKRTPVVIDGFVCGAAAMLAVLFCPYSKNYMFPSHLSSEKGHGKILNWLGLKPLFNLEMRLGEGTGAVLAFPFFDAAMKIFHEMATFDEANISR